MGVVYWVGLAALAHVYSMVMNLEGVVSYSKHRVLTYKIIPLLCLIKQWSAQQDDAMLDTPCILYILQTLQKSLSKRETTLTLKSMLEDIKRIFTPSRFEEYETGLLMVCTDLSAFTGVFKDLKSLISSASATDSNKDPLIDEKNGIIGGFIRHCVHEYQKMTFSQTVTLQRKWNKFYNNANCMTESLKIRKKMNRELLAEAKQNKEYTSAIEKLMLPMHHIKSSSGTPVELKALHLAMLFTQFDHAEEGKVVLKEAIRMAQMTENTSVLEHSMALLQRFTTPHHCTSRPLITELIKHATDNKDNLLMSTGKLQLSKVEIQLNSSPIRVLDILLSTEFDIFTSYEDSCHKCSVRSSALLLRASLFRQYGLRYLSLLPLQLLCHLNNCERDVSQHRLLDDTKAVSLIALTLSEEGRTNEAIAMIESSIHHLSGCDKNGDSKFLCQCLAELNLQKLFDSDDLQGYWKFIKQLAVYDSSNARFWEIKALIHSKQYSVAIKQCNQELAKSNEEDEGMDHGRRMFQARYQLLLVEIYTMEHLYSRAMDVALNCLTFSEDHQLWDVVVTVKLKIANLQLCLELVSSSRETIDHVLPILLAHGNKIDRALAFFICAQTYLMENSEKFLSPASLLQQSGIHEGLKFLDLSVNESHSSLFQTTTMKRVLALQKLLSDVISI